MPTMQADLIGTIPCQCTLGEGPVWDDRLGRLWWTDIQQARLHYWDWDGGKSGWFDCPERLGSLGLSSQPDWLICAFASGFALFRPESAAVRWIVRPEEDYRGIRFNDGRVDRLGNFWAGSMVEDESLANGAGGSLYRLTPKSELTRLLDGIGISNGIAWSPDGQWMWFADSTKGVVQRFTYDPFLGSLSEPVDYAFSPEGSSPDGSDVDADGALWNAEWGGACLTRYIGDQSQRVALPVTQPTCMAFAGPNLDHIFVTSAREGLDDDQLAAQPEAGNVLILKTSVAGLPAPKFPLLQM
ncbi:SMP-30/gluconolactonase/LRE family protein [Novosphingobium aerophilum]|uniref:SMP-30/gluconolactonase/LRE family protein n=1 Tax=Novosphingobium aerophilum TaxID=2839843 RepID=UPI0016399343|nr:SMP-30/gluconolactonase/LRE family protein [Novosphingobium aerophilum]